MGVVARDGSDGAANPFSVTRGGLIERLLIRLRITSVNEANTARRVAFFVAVTWAPLFILAALEGLLLPGRVAVPFLMEPGIHARFLLAVPMLLVAEVFVDARVQRILNQFVRADLVPPEQMGRFDRAKRVADGMCDAVWIEVVFIIAIIVNVAVRVSTNSLEATSWAFPSEVERHALSLAGTWAVFVAVPLFQLLVLRWLWRWIIWFCLLFLIAKIDLRVHPSHPDRAGGLGFLGEPPLPFGLVTMALGVLVSALIADRMLFLGTSLTEHYAVIAVFGSICILVNVVPLLVFVRRLFDTRERGILDMNALVIDHHRQFDRKWLARGSDDEALLGNADASSGVDVSWMYESVREMSPLPFDVRTMFTSVVASLLPLVPLVLLELPIAEAVKVLASIVF